MSWAPRHCWLLGSAVACVMIALASPPLAVAADDDDTAEPLDAEAIVARSLDQGALGIQDGEATLEMTITDADGRVLERTLRSRSQVVDGARRTRITFTEPADQRGVEVLLIANPDGPDAQYMWLPRLGERRRIAAASKHARFEGSDFSYADLEQRRPDAGRLERLPDAEWGGQPVYRVDIRPGDDPADDDDPYGEVSLWIAKEIWIPLRIVFRDRRGDRVKELRVRRIRKLDDRYAPTHLEMRDARRGGRTEIRVLAHDGDRTFSPEVFTPEALGR